MRKLLFLPVLMLVASELSYSSPDFSGYWIYEKSASTLPVLGNFLITFTVQTLTISVEYTNANPSEYILDCQPHVKDTESVHSTYTASLKGNTISIIGIRTSRTQGNYEDHFRVTYTLSKDGKKLTYFVNNDRRPSTIPLRAVFKKQILK